MTSSTGNLPPFDDDGLLAPGVYDLTLDELAASSLVIGPDSPSWDSAWRGSLVRNLDVLVRQLWQVGITDVYVDGSFVEDKARPNDIDGYFPCDLAALASGRLEEALNRIDPAACWTWSGARRHWDERSGKASCRCGSPTMWNCIPMSGRGQGSSMRMVTSCCFRRSRAGDRGKGIVRIVRAEGAP